MNASSSLRLIMLSSTMRTLIGGTAPSRRPRGKEGFVDGLDLLPRLPLILAGRGEEILGGGVAARWAAVTSVLRGGVGSGGGAGGPFR